MGATKIYPVSFAEDGIRDTASPLSTAQPSSTSSDPDATQVESLLDSLIHAYVDLRVDSVVDINRAFDNVGKLLDMCNLINERISEVRVYQSLLASAARCLSLHKNGSPDKIAKASKYSLANKGKGHWSNFRFTQPILPNAEQLIKHSIRVLTALGWAMSLKVEAKSLKLTFMTVLKKALRTKKACRSSLAELKIAADTVQSGQNEEDFSENLQIVSTELDTALNKVEVKLNIFKAVLIKKRVSLLDFLTYSV